MENGVVSHYGLSKDPCHQPDLLHIHGSFISPNYQLTTTNLFPVFSAQKIGGGINPEIRIPAPLYWKSEPEFYSPDSYPEWVDKADKVFWRGGNTGGRVNASNWKGFHRHRLVTMLNHSNIQSAIDETGSGGGRCSAPWARVDPLCQILGERPITDSALLVSHAEKRFDVGFNAYGCVDPSTSFDCAYLDDYYRLLKPVPLKEGQRHKYLLDVDGNGFSGMCL